MSVRHISPVTSGDTPPADTSGPQPGYSKSSIKYGLFGICLVVLCVSIVLLLNFTVKRKKMLSRQNLTAVETREAAASAVKETPVIHLDTVIVKSCWSLLTGMHPTVTLNATVHNHGCRIRYCLFSYRLRNDSNWMYIDAVRKGREHYSVKLRDLERGAVYEYRLLAVSRDIVFCSGIRRFAISE